ncbi:MAG: hypothetical protein WCJ09_14880 [Planctomycetota bacterium]
MSELLRSSQFVLYQPEQGRNVTTAGAAGDIQEIWPTAESLVLL